jgi:glucose-6-phosphate isomerase
MAHAELEFGSLRRVPEIRRVADMIEVILDQAWARRNRDVALYYMYRDLWMGDDRKKILERGLRYDITVIPPLSMGREFVKTKGHYHPECVPGTSYPEIYEVLEGEAHFLLQRGIGGEIEDVVMVKARSGEKLIIPPNYGHVTINPGPTTLKLANWVCRNFSSLYEEYVKRCGAAYYELNDGSLVPNPNYESLPEPRMARACEIPELGIERGRPLYSLTENLDRLAFLTRPQDFEWVFERAFR